MNHYLLLILFFILLIMAGAVYFRRISSGYSSIRAKLKDAENELATYKDVIDNIQDVYYRSDEHGRLVMANPSLIQLTGYDSLDECIGKSIADDFYYYPEERTAFLKELRENGRVSNYETVLKRKDGTPFIVETNSHFYYDNNGNVAGVEGILRDITDRKKAGEALKNSENLLKEVVNASPIPQFVIDVNHCVIQWNRALEEYSGIKREEIIGTKNHWRAFYLKDRPCLADLILDNRIEYLPEWYKDKYSRSRLIDNAYEAVDFFPDMKGGTWLYFTAALLRDKDGSITGAVETLEDITENKKADEALVDSQKQLRERTLFLEALLSAIPIPIFYKDADGHYLGCNDLYSEIMGIERDGFIGKTAFDLWPRELADLYYMKDQELLRSGNIQVYESRVKNRYGETRDVIFRKSLFTNADGSTGGIIGAYFDITELKAVEEALRLSEEKFRTIFKDSPLGIVQTTLDGHFLSANRVFCDMMGYSETEILMMTIADISFEGEFEKERPQVKKLSDGSSSYYTFEKRYRTKSGKSLWGHVSIAYIHDSNRQPVSTIGIVEDITDRKKADEDMRKMESQLLQNQKIEALGTLAGGIAHDFNNILSAIIGNTELAGIYIKNSDKASAKLQEVLKAAERAKNLVNQILTFSRKTEIRYSPIDLQTSINESLKMLRAVIPSDIKIQQELGESIVVMSDQTQIHQIIMNLCINAAQSMEKEGGVLSIALQKTDIKDKEKTDALDLAPGEYALIVVKDTGHGMTQEVMDRIFLPYFTTKQSGRGTGLGLAVIQGIIKKHRGAITCTSVPGQGSTFNIYIPAVTALSDVLNVTSDTDHQNNDVLIKGKGRILFVDDEPSLVSMASDMFRSLGYEVTTETASIKALEIFLSNPEEFDLVITDMTMPAMTGDKLAEKIKAVRGDIPIIICTGYSDRISEDELKMIGINELYMKPLELKSIAKIIHKVLHK